MKCYSLLSIFLIFTFSSFSQTKNNAEGKITYEYISHYTFEKVNRQATFFFSENNSVFIDSKGKEPIVYMNGVNFRDGYYVQDKIGNLIFKDFALDTIQIRKLVNTEPYVTKEPLPKFNWKIKDSIKSIGSFKCRLATTTFRGRNYNAWFTQKIPFSDGPWKFSGLPGMILEVVSDDNDYQFLFKSIEMPLKDKKEIITFNNDGTYLDFEKFKTAEDIEFQKMKKQGEAKWLSSGGKPGGYTLTKNPTNPIELSYGKED